MKGTQAETNEHGQAIGAPLPNWQAPPVLSKTIIGGELCRLEPLSVESHATQLFEAFSTDVPGRVWTYLPYGPFDGLIGFCDWVSEQARKDDPLFYSVVDTNTGRAIGVASFMRVMPAMGVVEIGHLNFSPSLQRTAAATEALYLMIDHIFELGYRRCEWKCNALNEASRNAALRLGFSYEGTFRQAAVIKGRNRDTAWFSLLDSEWPLLETAFTTWLSPDNFAKDGRQRQSLSALTSTALNENTKIV
ncbi:GNAT family N-acetyltransferase [Zhongshania sp.]|uniref:GNAT family N-acetyltransferase n=1 Tax=Zhongshania sp. TaxID=1971902 RepID=UPI00356677D7